jgi:hypothetical protein
MPIIAGTQNTKKPKQPKPQMVYKSEAEQEAQQQRGGATNINALGGVSGPDLNPGPYYSGAQETNPTNPAASTKSAGGGGGGKKTSGGGGGGGDFVGGWESGAKVGKWEQGAVGKWQKGAGGGGGGGGEFPRAVGGQAGAKLVGSGGFIHNERGGIEHVVGSSNVMIENLTEPGGGSSGGGGTGNPLAEAEAAVKALGLRGASFEGKSVEEAVGRGARRTRKTGAARTQ